MPESSLAPLPLKVVEGAPSSPFPFGELNTVVAPLESDRMKQLERMLQETQGRAEIIEKEAYDKAYRAGEKTGMDLGKKRAEKLLSSMEKLLHLSEEELARMHSHVNEAVLEIAETVIHHVVGEMVRDHPAYLKQMVEKCANELPAYGTLTLAVAPEDMSMFEKLLENNPDGSELIPDAHVQPGTCRIMARNNDVFIDPRTAIVECMQHIRDELLVKYIPANTSTPDPHDSLA